MKRITDNIQVHVPFAMLHATLHETFVTHRLNPEIFLDAGALERFSFADFKGIAALLRDHALTVTIHAPFLDLSPGSFDPDVTALTRRRFEQILKLVPVFTPRTVVCHAGYDRKRYWPWRDRWIENSLEMWSWLGGRIMDEGACLVLENVYEDGPEDIRVLFENLADRRVGFCLDTGHQAAFSNAPLETWLEVMDLFLKQLHLHDNTGNWDDHLGLGQGNIDFQIVFDHLKAGGKPLPVITLETHREADLWSSVAFLERLWPW